MSLTGSTSVIEDSAIDLWLLINMPAMKHPISTPSPSINETCDIIRHKDMDPRRKSSCLLGPLIVFKIREIGKFATIRLNMQNSTMENSKCPAVNITSISVLEKACSEAYK
ncbi:11038_t:CDS:1 [Racocetra fulgida]|uniref:11038_t:CDS:1 n=1 Tax=Racocetra fulgida TaxID=60492 RepID=A0A9N8W3M5_9GLOM|nr:11038_t:CDS:1 [Racocetra fulgida]